MIHAACQKRPTGRNACSGSKSCEGMHEHVDRRVRCSRLGTAAVFVCPAVPRSTYSGGKLAPFVLYVLDPVNKFNQEVIWRLDYFITNDVILNLSQRYVINTTACPVFESWRVAGINRGRSETGIRLTYQF